MKKKKKEKLITQIQIKKNEIIQQLLTFLNFYLFLLKNKPKNFKEFTKFGSNKKVPLETTGLFSSGGESTGSGFLRVAQPLDLYTSMNTPGGYTYPEFSGPRQWMGGFGNVNVTEEETVALSERILEKYIEKL